MIINRKAILLRNFQDKIRQSLEPGRPGPSSPCLAACQVTDTVQRRPRALREGVGGCNLKLLPPPPPPIPRPSQEGCPSPPTPVAVQGLWSREGQGQGGGRDPTAYPPAADTATLILPSSAHHWELNLSDAHLADGECRGVER